MKILRDIRNIGIIFIIVGLPVIIFTSLFFDKVYDREIAVQKELFTLNQKLTNEIMSRGIHEIIGEAYRNFNVIEDSDEMYRYLQRDDKVNRGELEQLFLRMAKNIDDIDKIGFLDLDGMEIINISIEKDSAPVLLKEDDMENRSSYSYFIESVANEGSTFISEIEDTGKAVFEISRLLSNEEGDKAGVLVLTFRADSIFEFFSDFNMDDGGIERILLDSGEKVIAGKGSSFALFNDGDIDGYGYLEIYDQDELMNYVINSVDFDYEGEKLKTYPMYIVSGYRDDIIAMMNEDSFFDLVNMKSYIYIRLCLLLLMAVSFFYFMTKKERSLSINKTIADTTSDGVAILDNKRRVVFVNSAYEKITGFDFNEIEGSLIFEFKFDRQDDSFYNNIWNKVNSLGSWQGDLWDRRKDGLIYPRHLDIRSIKSRFGQVSNYIGISKDLSDKKTYMDRVENLENYNQITNLPNFNLLKKRIDVRISAKRRFSLVCVLIKNYDNLQLSLGNTDLDEFIRYYINDVMKAFGKENRISHVSERRFVVELLKNERLENLYEFMELVMEHFNRPFDYKGQMIKVEVKTAVVRYPEDGKESVELLENAALALDNICNEMGKGYIFYKDEIRKPVLRRLNIEKELQKALEKGEFEIYFQPKMEMSSKRVTCAEALLRWKSSLLGNVSPAEFIPIAENSDLIIDIDKYVISKVIEIISVNADTMGGKMNISINVSGKSFEKFDVYEMVMNKVSSKNIRPEMITVEITETTLMENVDHINDTLKKLRKEGVRISIDDFGTGFSSLSYLKLLETDEIKIDRSFIMDYPDNDDGSIAKYIKIMADSLGLDTVAEGVETIEQIKFLESIACKYIQGYYYSRPLPENEFIEYIKASMPVI